MYIMQRQNSYWIFNTAEEIWKIKAVQVRKDSSTSKSNEKPSPKTFDEFLKRLESGELVIFGWNIIFVWCCFNCVPDDECKYYQAAKRTYEETIEFHNNISKLISSGELDELITGSEDK